MLEVGEQAPVFTLKSTTGEEISLTDYNGKKCCALFLP